nr:hypothetical protein [Brucella anthropi]
MHAHLTKDQGARVEIINCAAHDLRSAMDDMQLARDASRADAAFLHLSLSPGRDMTDDELRQVADIVLRHFEADEHPAALVIHDKDRASGKGNTHGHLVVGRVGYDGQVLPSGFEKIRLETAMRIVEFEMGEPATLGRHHVSAVKWLRANGREDVANWLDMQFGVNPGKPKSPASPAKRQKIERATGINMSTLTSTVRSAWERSDNPQAFSAALAESGIHIQKGQKDGVFLVLKDGVQVGALDRLLKEKRRSVAVRMEGFEYGETRTNPNGSHSSNLARSASESKERRAASTIVGATRTTGADRRRANSANSGRTGTDHSEPEASNDVAQGPRRQSGRFDQIQAVKRIEAHQFGWDRLRGLCDDFVAFLRDFVSTRKSEPQFSDRDHEIATMFEKACRYSAENMERLEKLDPDLAAYREHYGEHCQGLSHEQILQNLANWRERGQEIVTDMSVTPDDDHDYQPPSMRF